MMYSVIKNGKKIGEAKNKYNAGDVIPVGFSSYEIQSVLDERKEFIVESIMFPESFFD